MRHLPTSSLPLVFAPLLLPALAAEEGQALTPAAAAEGVGQKADETLGGSAQVDAILQQLGVAAEPAAVAFSPDSPMPEAEVGQSAAVCDGGLFFDAGNSRLVYMGNVRLNDARVQLRAAHRLYLQLPKDELNASAEQAGKKVAQGPGEVPAAPPEEAEGTGSESPATEAAEFSAAPDVPLEVTAYDAMVDSVGNRMIFTSGPGVSQLVFRQGNNCLVMAQDADSPARAMADEAGNLLLEAPSIRLTWQEEDGSVSEFYTGGGRALYHAATHALLMEGPVDASYRNGESTLRCTRALCITLKPEEGAKPRSSSGFMSQFAAMRFSGVAAATATGNVHLSSRTGGEEISVSGDALHYNGLTGAVEVPGTPCIISYGEGGRNVLQTQGSLVLEPSGDIHLKGTGPIEGIYERPAREKGAPPLRGTLSAMAPLTFHADSGTVTTRALDCRDAESSISCTGDVLLVLTPRRAEKLAAARLPSREKAGMVNLALARYSGISAIKASGQVRGELLDPAAPGKPEASLSASQLDANLTTGEVLLTGAGEPAAIAFRGYSLSGTPTLGEPASVQLKANGDIEARGAQVSCTIPGEKGVTTLTSAERVFLAREQRSLSMGANTRIQSPDGIVTTNGPLTAVLAASAKPAKPLSEQYPQLSYDFTGLESAETFEGASIRTAQGSMQCAQRLSILMQPQGSSNTAADMGGIRSAIAVGQVSLAARDSQGRMMRAIGDRLDIDGTTGEKRLTGNRVVLEDARNRHEASGAGAAVRIDARNNARISGERHTTSATGIRKQVDEKDGKATPTAPTPNAPQGANDANSQQEINKPN